MKTIRILNFGILAGLVGFFIGIGWAVKHVIAFENVDLIEMREQELTDELIANWLESGDE